VSSIISVDRYWLGWINPNFSVLSCFYQFEKSFFVIFTERVDRLDA